MDLNFASARQGPEEDTDAWLERVEDLLTYVRDNRSSIGGHTAHDSDLKDLGADRHTYAQFWDFYAVTEAMVSSS